MSYDVFLQRFQHGAEMPVDSPAVWRLITDSCETPPDEDGFCRVRRGNDEGDLYGARPGRPIESLMLNHAGPAIYHLMYDLAVAGDMTIFGPDLQAITREEQREHLPAELREDAVIVDSGAALLRIVESG
jgi:hypothetical protein